MNTVTLNMNMFLSNTRFTRVEYVVHILVAASQEYANTWHAPSSRHLRAFLSVCGGCSFGGLGCCSCRVCVCVGVGGVVLCRCVCVCVCDLLKTYRVGARAAWFLLGNLRHGDLAGISAAPLR